MNLKIAYSLMREFPLPRLVAALESANEDPPKNMADDAARIARLMSGTDGNNEQVLRDIARLIVTTPAITGQIAMRSQTVEDLMSNQTVAQAFDMLKTAGFGVLHIAEQKTEHRSPVLSRLLKMCQEELATRSG
jgi:hypothetical protein